MLWNAVIRCVSIVAVNASGICESTAPAQAQTGPQNVHRKRKIMSNIINLKKHRLSQRTVRVREQFFYSFVRFSFCVDYATLALDDCCCSPLRSHTFVPFRSLLLLLLPMFFFLSLILFSFVLFCSIVFVSVLRGPNIVAFMLLISFSVRAQRAHSHHTHSRYAAPCPLPYHGDAIRCHAMLMLDPMPCTMSQYAAHFAHCHMELSI